MAGVAYLWLSKHIQSLCSVEHPVVEYYLIESKNDKKIFGRASGWLVEEC